MAMTARDMASRIARRDERDAPYLALVRLLAWPTSAQIAQHLGVTHRAATKRLVAMRSRGLVIRLGVAKCDSQWALVDDIKAQKQAAADRVKPRVRSTVRREMAPRFTQRVVPASSRAVPSNLGPRSVFDLAAAA